MPLGFHSSDLPGSFVTFGWGSRRRRFRCHPGGAPAPAPAPALVPVFEGLSAGDAPPSFKPFSSSPSASPAAVGAAATPPRPAAAGPFGCGAAAPFVALPAKYTSPPPDLWSDRALARNWPTKAARRTPRPRRTASRPCMAHRPAPALAGARTPRAGARRPPGTHSAPDAPPGARPPGMPPPAWGHPPSPRLFGRWRPSPPRRKAQESACSPRGRGGRTPRQSRGARGLLRGRGEAARAPGQGGRRPPAGRPPRRPLLSPPWPPGGGPPGRRRRRRGLLPLHQLSVY